ncbi:structural maintenance of chromosomes protein 1A-like, partial [Nilaparvata lugens]|uniref:structural maintenance of chromosomes protein 1A-like n=1 Tax=Nilaparvata lugens TaxID=108931 RepID=UPI00193E5018
VNEYNRLKVEAQKQSARFLQELDSINREQKAEQDNLPRPASVRPGQHHQAEEHEKAEAAKRVDKLNEHIRTSERALEEQKALHHELQSYVGSSKERIKELNTELETVQQQLGDAKVDKHEDSRRKKKQEIVENFKRLHPGVYDRLINMCQPIHKRFNVAITKVLGKYMEAIVVDTEKTARMCINYLKEHMLDPETFLPLDYIQTKPLKERLRNIKEPKNVKLLYDVLNYSPPEIKRVILFATNNALVCDTPEDAMKVAYEMDGQNRYDVSRFQELIDDLNEELRELVKKSRKESELNTIDSQIRGLDQRLKYSKNDLEKT